MIKLIVSDIDGTLVGDGQGAEYLCPDYYNVIENLRKRGILFMACSGRQRYSVAQLFDPISDQIYYACDGGSLVFDEKKLIYSRELPRETVWEIFDDAEKIPQMDVMVCGSKRAYCRSKDSELYRWMVEGYGYDIEAVGDLKSIEDKIVK
ncbi:MAG: Cof-type HAD-IIB family hydrolase, partial [Eubacterium sp.]|nr:Cof-type HAD-IIB family hydrolase [Eubacterium sp.]